MVYCGVQERGQQSVGVVREQYVQQRFASLRRLREKEAELLGEVGRPQSGEGIEAEAEEQGAHAPGSAAPKGTALVYAHRLHHTCIMHD